MADPDNLADVTAELAQVPPLVFAGECDQLMGHLGQAARGEAFVLMGGDCAETFAANTADSIRARLKTVLQMAVVLQYGSRMPVVKIGRMAGQYSSRGPSLRRPRTDRRCPRTSAMGSTTRPSLRPRAGSTRIACSAPTTRPAPR